MDASKRSSIPQISGPSVTSVGPKTTVILRHKNYVSNQQTIVDKIKQYNKSGAQLVPQLVPNGDHQNNAQTVAPMVSKRTSASSASSSARSDSSASLCGHDSGLKTKPMMTPMMATIGGKSRVNNNYSQNTCLLINTINTNTNITNNLCNNLSKKSQEMLNTCDNNLNNNKINRNSSHYSNAKNCSIGAKRGIPPPRSRATSTIIDNMASLPTIISNCQSVSNTSLTTIAKPTAVVKGTSKVLPQQSDHNNTAVYRMTTGRKSDGTTPGAEHTSQCNSFGKMKAIGSPKPDSNHSSMSPIMATTELNHMIAKHQTLVPKQLDPKTSTYVKRNGAKQSDRTHTFKGDRCLPQQQSHQNGLQDSASSSHEEESASNSDVESALVNIKPMQPLVRTSQFAFLSSNGKQMSNRTTRFPNNYSTIEVGYMSDCTQLDCQSRSPRSNTYRSCHSTTGAANGYLSESDTRSPQLKSMGPNRQYKDTDSVSNGIRGGNLFDLMHPKPSPVPSDHKNGHEVRRMRRELDLAYDKVSTLTSQLTTNAHMVAAFEQSLSSMTARLQQLNASAELKDCELDRLRAIIENLKKQGLISDTPHASPSKQSNPNSRIARQLSVESVSSVSSGADGPTSQLKLKKKPKTAKILNNTGSGSWLRSSFSKAFKKNKSFVKRDALSDVEGMGNGSEGESNSVPSSPLMSLRPFHSELNSDINDLNDSDDVQILKRQIREKEMVITDLRLEGLTSAHQLENLKEKVNHLRAEMLNLKQDNERLNRLITSKSLASSQSSMASCCVQNSHSTNGSTKCRQKGTIGENNGNSLESLEMEGNSNSLLSEGGKLVSIGSGTHVIASLVVTPKTNWDQLDLMIKKLFKEHISRIDSECGLGLTLDALACYQVGAEKIQRIIVVNKPSPTLPSLTSNPELLPFGYLVNESHICLQFKTASDSLVFDTLTPKPIIQRFVGLLNEDRRIILCGPSGTGKTYLAHKLAEYLAVRRAAENRSVDTSTEGTPVGSIATFSVDHKSAKELRAYLSNVAEQCESEALSLHLPTVIILDNLHHVSDISEVFNGLLNITHTKCPFIIGTMNQTTCSTTSLQRNYNFRWVLCANHTEPVKGFLSRFLRRKYIETEVKMVSNNMTVSPELNNVIEWIPKLWNHLNQFLETHSSSDVTIGPRLFSSCPMDVNGSQVWFTDLWNYSIVPYVVETTREGIQMYGKRTPFTDPTDWVIETYPWSASTCWPDWAQNLLRIRAEDVNYETDKPPDCHQNEDSDPNCSDPLLNMLLRLQEAANYSNSSQQNESFNQNNDYNNDLGSAPQ